MKQWEAKEWLSACVPGTDVSNDSEIREALRMAESDPELREWLARQHALDPQVKAALQAVPVPGSLEADLLVLVGGKLNRRTLFRGRGMAWMTGLAAAIVLCASTLFILSRNEALVQDIQAVVTGTTPDSFEHFRDGMAYYIRNVYFQLDHHSDDLASIEAWLKAGPSPAYEFVPDALQELIPIGCKQLKWQGNDVSLVCFHTESGKIVHLFILDRGDVDPTRFRDIQQIRISQGLETGGWITDQKVYVLVGSDPSVDIEFALG